MDFECLERCSAGVVADSLGQLEAVQRDIETMKERFKDALRTISKAIAGLEGFSGTDTDELRGSLQESSQLLSSLLQDLVAHAKARQIAKKSFVISVFGRTGVGKSTLTSALVQADGSNVSSGRSGYTRKIRQVHRPESSLCIIDVPGLDDLTSNSAKNEHEAKKAVMMSDLVILCFDTQNQKVSDFEGVGNLLLRYQKPVLVVLNVRNPAWRSPLHGLSPAEHDYLQRQVRQHIARLSIELQTLGLPRVPICALSCKRSLFARAASTYAGPDADELAVWMEKVGGPEALLESGNGKCFFDLLQEAISRTGAEMRVSSLRGDLRGASVTLTKALAAPAALQTRRWLRVRAEVLSLVVWIGNPMGDPALFELLRGDERGSAFDSQLRQIIGGEISLGENAQAALLKCDGCGLEGEYRRAFDDVFLPLLARAHARGRALIDEADARGINLGRGLVQERVLPQSEIDKVFRALRERLMILVTFELQRRAESLELEMSAIDAQIRSEFSDVTVGNAKGSRLFGKSLQLLAAITAFVFGLPGTIAGFLMFAVGRKLERESSTERTLSLHQLGVALAAAKDSMTQVATSNLNQCRVRLLLGCVGSLITAADSYQCLSSQLNSILAAADSLAETTAPASASVFSNGEIFGEVVSAVRKKYLADRGLSDQDCIDVFAGDVLTEIFPPMPLGQNMHTHNGTNISEYLSSRAVSAALNWMSVSVNKKVKKWLGWSQFPTSDAADKYLDDFHSQLMAAECDDLQRFIEILSGCISRTKLLLSSRTMCVSLIGEYSSGKTSLIQRLLFDCGPSTPAAGDYGVGAGPVTDSPHAYRLWVPKTSSEEWHIYLQTCAVDFDKFGIVPPEEIPTENQETVYLVDLPGLGSGDEKHDEIALHFARHSAAVILVLPPQVVTGKTMSSDLKGIIHGDGTLSGVPAIVCVSRADEFGSDPILNRSGYVQRCRGKAEEASSLMNVSLANVNVVCADPLGVHLAKVLGRINSDGGAAEETGEWDGVVNFQQQLKSLVSDLRGNGGCVVGALRGLCYDLKITADEIYSEFSRIDEHRRYSDLIASTLLHKAAARLQDIERSLKERVLALYQRQKQIIEIELEKNWADTLALRRVVTNIRSGKWATQPQICRGVSATVGDALAHANSVLTDLALQLHSVRHSVGGRRFLEFYISEFREESEEERRAEEEETERILREREEVEQLQREREMENESDDAASDSSWVEIENKFAAGTAGEVKRKSSPLPWAIKPEDEEEVGGGENDSVVMSEVTEIDFVPDEIAAEVAGIIFDHERTPTPPATIFSEGPKEDQSGLKKLPRRVREGLFRIDALAAFAPCPTSLGNFTLLQGNEIEEEGRRINGNLSAAAEALIPGQALIKMIIEQQANSARRTLEAQIQILVERAVYGKNQEGLGTELNNIVVEISEAASVWESLSMNLGTRYKIANDFAAMLRSNTTFFSSLCP